jgi:quercetin dioxygenase-like cupin family protein/diadenosine tetraphosphatase ApaH/serine/threonine PP2A family protein phosphatase
VAEVNGSANQYYLLDPYRDFLKEEGVPVYEEYSVDCNTLPVEPWQRLGGKGAYIHLAGRGDYLSSYLAEIPAGGQLNVERHLHEESIYVVSGRGATTVEVPGQGKHTFEWKAGATFGIPLNAYHQHFNGSGTEPARFVAVTNLALMLNLFHDVDYIYKNPYVFDKRAKEERYFHGEGELRQVRPGRHNWETNFVPDLVNFSLPAWKERGAAGNNIQFCLADSTLHAHISEFGVGTYKKAHWHGSGAHIFCVTGEGYSLLWKDGEDPVNTTRVEWHPGVLYAPPDGPTYHQHFNLANVPSRYFVLGFGGVRYPVLDTARKTYEGMDRSKGEGGIQIEYEDEDPRILELFESELAKRGIKSNMREFVGARAVEAG